MWRLFLGMRHRPTYCVTVTVSMAVNSITGCSSLGIEEVLTAPRSPWQNPYVERLIGSIRRECLNHVIVFNDRHLKRLLHSYFAYYHTLRTHLALDQQCPHPRLIERQDRGRIIAFPHVDGLHHEYRRVA